MKILSAVIIILILYCPTVHSQNKIDTINWRTTKIPFFGPENIFTSKSDFKWVQKGIYSLVDISYLSLPEKFLQMDIIGLHTKNFNFYGFSYFSESSQFMKNKLPYDLTYALPLGFRLPILCGERYSLSFNSNLYWLSLNIINTDLEHKGATVHQPIFLDSQILYEYKYGIGAFLGYRNQFSDWYVKNNDAILYSNKLSGLYFGLKVGISGAIRTNKGKERWLAAKRINNPSSYGSFLNIYPNSRYTNEALYRMELTTYQKAITGVVADCNLYLSKYPQGNYIEKIQTRREQLEFGLAKNGDINDCDNYIKNNPNGKNIEIVNKIRQERIEKPELDSYQLALKGSFRECDDYLRNFANGKYSLEISNLRTQKYDKEELEIYSSSINGKFKDCNIYLRKYPDGKFVNEVKKIMDNKYENEENELFEKIFKGKNLADCENYFSDFSTGLHFDMVFKLFRKIKHDALLSDHKLIMELMNPEINKIVIDNSFNFSKINFRSDILIEGQTDKGILASGLMAFNMGSLFDSSMSSAVGLPNSIIDITLFPGFKFVNKSWFPVSKKDNSYIIVLSDKIVGINVRYE